LDVLNAIELWLGLARGMLGQAIGLPSPWEHSIRAFEARDRRRAPVPGSIVFVGSSSFTLWSSLEEDMALLPVVNRGFGGALIDDVVCYADRIVAPYHPAAVVLFAGTNDIAGARPASAQYVAERFDAFVARVRLAVPDALIFYVAITPSRARWSLWPVAMEANRLIEARVRADAGLRFIDLNRFLLGSDGTPDLEFYRRDGLHPNKSGYRIWAREIAAALHHEPALMEKLGVSD
jgi:lysophospholipase L1-like esterase